MVEGVFVLHLLDFYHSGLHCSEYLLHEYQSRSKLGVFV